MKKRFFTVCMALLPAACVTAQVRITASTVAPPSNITATAPLASNVVVGNSTYTGTAADNTFIGNNAGSSAVTGTANTFIGQGVGLANTSGGANTFIGAWTGASNTTGGANTFLGQFSGFFNRTGSQNTFVGQHTGELNTAGSYNTFIGKNAGQKSLADANTFIGHSAGINTGAGQSNTFLGTNAGAANTTGFNNLALGTNADFSSAGLFNAAAIGYNARAAASNSIILGGTGSNAVNVGIGTSMPAAHLHLLNTQPEQVIFSTSNTGTTGASTLSLQILTAAGTVLNGLDLSVSGPGLLGTLLNNIPATAVPAVLRKDMGYLTTTTVPLTIGINGNANVSQDIHFINSVRNALGSFNPTECMRINKNDGFVGIHSRTANSAGGSGAPQALFHVNLTNITSAVPFNPLLNGIRFEGLPRAAHPDVIVVDALGNLATRPYSASGGPIPCDSVIKCAWGLRGNTINPGDYIGTNNVDDFRFYTSATQRGKVTWDGNWDFGANTFLTATMSSALGNDNFIGLSQAALASGETNRIRSSNYGTALGLVNSLEDAEASFAAGAENIITTSTAAAALGGSNIIAQSSRTFAAGDANIIQAGSDKSAAIGDRNEVTSTAGSFTAGSGNQLNNNNKGTIVLGADNFASVSNESIVAGEKNTMTNAHGTVVLGGHNTSTGPYHVVAGANNLTSGDFNMVLGSWSNAVSGMPRAAPKTPVGSNIMVVGEQLTNSLNNSLTMGFNANRTVVITERGMAVQMDPTGTFTFAPTHNLVVDANPASTGVGSNIAFKNLPPTTTMLPVVLVDGNGELYQSSTRIFRSAGNEVIADMKIQKDTKPISTALDMIDKITPRQYTVDAAAYPDLAMPSGKTSFGFVAQELEKVLPALVSETTIPGNEAGSKTTATLKSINYNELLPILVQALKDQQAQLAEQQQQMNTLLAVYKKTGAPPAPETEKSASISIRLSDAAAIILEQNVPNPGDQFTAIGFSIPATVQSAAISFANMEGKVIKTVTIAARGKGVFNLYTAGLSKGTYTYTLIADGRKADTKKMIISR